MRLSNRLSLSFRIRLCQLCALQPSRTETPANSAKIEGFTRCTSRPVRTRPGELRMASPQPEPRPRLPCDRYDRLHEGRILLNGVPIVLTGEPMSTASDRFNNGVRRNLGPVRLY